MGKVFVGHDWAEAHRDVHIEDEQGRRLAKARLPEGVEGVARFHELVASFVVRVPLPRAPLDFGRQVRSWRCPGVGRAGPHRRPQPPPRRRRQRPGRGGEGVGPGSSVDDLDPQRQTNQLRSTLREFYQVAHRGLRNRGRRDYPSKPMSVSGLANLLSNKVYVGVVEWGGVGWGAPASIRPW